MRKSFFFSTLVVALIIVGITATNAAVPSRTIDYLRKQDQSNAWVLMALKASGQSVSAGNLSVDSLTSATTIERTILGAVASGENPYSFKGKDLVGLLDDHRNNSQIGNTTLLNDDIWGILAYSAAGVTLADSRINESKIFLLNHQNSDGGFGYATGVDSDSNDTAMAIVALIRAGIASSDSRITKALDYLKTAQNDDGGFAIAPGSESDSASTSWAISALQAAGKDANSWTKSGQTPFTYLQTTELSDGAYKWKASDTSASAIMTSYATIALAGTSYPVTKYTGTSTPTQTPTPTKTTTPTLTSTNFRIEGSQGQICQGQVNASNALQVVEKASLICNFSYVIEDTSFGPYLKSIGFDAAAGVNGWLYLVDWQQPTVGANDYQLKANDYVTWYYGEFDWQPTRLRVIAQTKNDDKLKAVILVESYSDSSWNALAKATVKYNNQSKSTDAQGKIAVYLSAGSYTIYAEKADYVRSNIETISVEGAMKESVPLKTTVVIPAPPPQPTPVIPEPEISFDVSVMSSSDDSVSFGNLQPGQTNTQTIMLKNNGDVQLGFTASVTGDSLFVDYLQLDNAAWNLFKQYLQPKKESNVNVSLTIPSGYSDGGTKSGELIFWATP